MKGAVAALPAMPEDGLVCCDIYEGVGQGLRHAESGFTRGKRAIQVMQYPLPSRQILHMQPRFSMAYCHSQTLCNANDLART